MSTPSTSTFLRACASAPRETATAAVAAAPPSISRREIQTRFILAFSPRFPVGPQSSPNSRGAPTSSRLSRNGGGRRGRRPCRARPAGRRKDEGGLVARPAVADAVDEGVAVVDLVLELGQHRVVEV